MEILNRNQRISAIWRLAGLGVLILAVNVVILLAINNAYAHVGDGEIDTVKREKQLVENSAKGTQQDLKNQIKALQLQVNTLKTENSKLKTDQENAAVEMKLVKMRNEQLERDYDRCIAMSKANQ